jgi:hypothetical protein
VSDKGIKFRVGVSGHRDILPDDIEAARQHSIELLSSLQSSMPATEISVISGLADGADRLFAEAALALGMSVEAVLPMPLKFYKSDFDATSLADLERMLDSEPVQCIELPLTPGLDGDEENWPEGARDTLYANLSQDLQRRSNLLVAIWDGKFKNLTGGTDDTVVRFLDAVPGPDGANIETTDASGALLKGAPLVYWIPAGRISSGGPDADLGPTPQTGIQHRCVDLREVRGRCQSNRLH